MTKSQLVAKLSKRAGAVPRARIESIVDAVFEAMRGAMTRRERIEIRGFGTFSVRARGPRSARNPRTGEQIRVEARSSPVFTVGKELRERLNPSEGEPEFAAP